MSAFFSGKPAGTRTSNRRVWHKGFVSGDLAGHNPIGHIHGPGRDTQGGKGGWLSHVSRQEKERFHEELKLLDIGLEKRMTQPVGLLSGGQRQALTLLMATMNPPKLLLLDEHTAALDPGTAEKVLNLTKRVVEEHQLTCLMITHNMQSALDLGNRILMMDSGDIVLDIHEEEKKGLTVEGLLEKFKTGAGKMLDNDRILLSGEK